MTRHLEIRIEELVVQGGEPLDAAAFERDLALALAERLGTAPATRRADRHDAAQKSAESIAAKLPTGSFGEDGP